MKDQLLMFDLMHQPQFYANQIYLHGCCLYAFINISY